VSDLSGKKALVTGAGMGIGQGIAVELARRGAEVAIHYAHTEPEEGGTRETAQSNARRVLLTRIHIGITMPAGEGLLESYRQG
jgi:NAD(P)-dependent dehydrogenase (short-subunit alcohol dehydrogenase family)